ncbi:unnamed protein product [Eruca vesicaria subsp. sativa]|uniref:Uncharacterized protein n=1 Tax=Eruca vesicaria subsp. sativa TaxID=29727 RepID=A0ABC8KBN4_ERUVS|nr:unnamed protein product [Eruca vesicaria subsp. sativa]
MGNRGWDPVWKGGLSSKQDRNYAEKICKIEYQQGRMVSWLMEDLRGFSLCKSGKVLERFGLLIKVTNGIWKLEIYFQDLRCGVVINGQGDQNQRPKEQLGYVGKGKGKMYEENMAEWTQVLERGSKSSYSHHNNNRMDDGDSRGQRGGRREQGRGHTYADRGRVHSGDRRGKRPLRNTGGEHHEEGEFLAKDKNLVRVRKEAEKVRGLMVERQELTITNNQEFAVAKEHVRQEKELELRDETAAEVTEGVTLLTVNETMDLGDDKIKLGVEEYFIGENDLQDLTDEEGKGVGEEGGLAEPDIEFSEVEEPDRNMGDGDKKAGTRKQLFVATGGNPAKKFRQVLLSPRKRATTKQGIIKGGGAKNVDEKGSLNPKPTAKH